MSSDWQTAFLASTRGRLFEYLRRGPKTVEELTALVGLSDNAVRMHLQTLQRDRLVRAAGLKRSGSPGKPAQVYEPEPSADERFSRAYAPLLQALVSALAERGMPEEVLELLREAGRKLGREMARRAPGRREQAAAAAAILTELGGRRGARAPRLGLRSPRMRMPFGEADGDQSRSLCGS